MEEARGIQRRLTMFIFSLSHFSGLFQATHFLVDRLCFISSLPSEIHVLFSSRPRFGRARFSIRCLLFDSNPATIWRALCSWRSQKRSCGGVPYEVSRSGSFDHASRHPPSIFCFGFSRWFQNGSIVVCLVEMVSLHAICLGVWTSKHPCSRWPILSGTCLCLVVVSAVLELICC